MTSGVEVLASRTDAFVVRVSGSLRPHVRRDVQARVRDMTLAGASGASLLVDGVAYALTKRSRPERFHAANASYEMLWDEGVHLGEWSLEIKAHARALATRGLLLCTADMRELADALLTSVRKFEVRRFDLAVDVVGIDLADLDPRAFVCPPRAATTRYMNEPDATKLSEHGRAARCTGFRIGSGGSLLARIYNKSQELADKRDEAKAQIEEDIWRRARGADGRLLWSGQTVVRVEAQLRGDILDELLDGRLRDPDQLPDLLDEVWAYVTRSWVRLVLLASATRRSRCATDPRWVSVQEACFFRHDVSEVPARRRQRCLAGARLALGILTNYVASRGSLPELDGLLDDDSSSIDLVESVENPKDLSLFNDEVLEALTRAATQELRRDLLEGMGSERKLAAFLLERTRLAKARSTLVETVGEQAGAAA